MRFIGYDGHGIPRVFGETVEEAKEEAETYVVQRPDTGPLSHWTFTHNKRRT